jgi:hypothetical protein
MRERERGEGVNELIVQAHVNCTKLGNKALNNRSCDASKHHSFTSSSATTEELKNKIAMKINLHSPNCLAAASSLSALKSNSVISCFRPSFSRAAR